MARIGNRPENINDENDFSFDVKIGDEWVNFGTNNVEVRDLSYQHIRAADMSSWVTIEVDEPYKIRYGITGNDNTKEYSRFVLREDPTITFDTAQYDTSGFASTYEHWYSLHAYASPNGKVFNENGGPDNVPNASHFRVWDRTSKSWENTSDVEEVQLDEVNYGKSYRITKPGRYKVVNAATSVVEPDKKTLAYSVTGGLLISLKELKKIWPDLETVVTDRGELVSYHGDNSYLGEYDSILIKDFRDGMKLHKGDKSGPYIQFFTSPAQGVQMGKYKYTSSARVIVCVVEQNYLYKPLYEANIVVHAEPVGASHGRPMYTGTHTTIDDRYNIYYFAQDPNNYLVQGVPVTIMPASGSQDARRMYTLGNGTAGTEYKKLVTQADGYQVQSEMDNLTAVWMRYERNLAAIVGFNDFEGGTQPLMSSGGQYILSAQRVEADGFGGIS